MKEIQAYVGLVLGITASLALVYPIKVAIVTGLLTAVVCLMSLILFSNAERLFSA